MNIHEYLFYNRLTATQFARKCDLSTSYVCSLLRGERKPSAKTLRIVKRVTDGKVTEFGPPPTMERFA